MLKTKSKQILDPTGSYKTKEHSVSSGDHSFEAVLDGRYTYCFSNENSNVGTKEVSFNVHGIVYVPEEPESSDPLEREVRNLGELLNQVKDEQEYIVVREQVHRNTAESTNSRVKWWSIFQLFVVGGNGVFQVWYLKRFFEVRFRLGCKGGHYANFAVAETRSRELSRNCVFVFYAL